jgi:hypothetical protein
MTWVLLLVQILLKAPEIIQLVRDIIALINLLKDPAEKSFFKVQLKQVVKKHLDRKSNVVQCSNDLGMLKKEVQDLLLKQK